MVRLIESADAALKRFFGNRGEPKDKAAYEARLNEAFEEALNAQGFQESRRTKYLGLLHKHFKHYVLPARYDAALLERMVKEAKRLAERHDPEEQND